MRGLIYCRKSSEDKTKQVLSLQDQLTVCQRLVEDKHIPVVARPFVEAKSGWKADCRVEFYKMLDLVKKGKADTIITWNMDRIGRNGEENGIVRDLISQSKLTIITPVDVYDSNNVLKAGVESLFNEEYSNKLSKIVKDRLRLKAERGEYPGNAPIGYRNTPQMLKGTRLILPDNKRWDLCRKWWELMLTGLYTIPQTLEKINAMGLTGKKGKTVSRTVAFRFFRDIFYAGNFVYGGVTYPGIHKPMITVTEYNKVQELLDSKNAKGPYSLVNPIPYLGLFKCPCGASITGERRTKNYKNGKSQTFTYYRCTKKKGPCGQKYLNAVDLEPQIKTAIDQLSLDPLFAEYFRKLLKRRNKEEFSFSIKQRELVTKQLNALDGEKDRLYGMKMDGLVDQKTYELKKQKLLLHEQTLKEQQSIKRTAEWEKLIDDAISFAENVSKVYESGNLYTRRMVLKILGSTLLIDNQKLKIVAKPPFRFFKDAEKRVFKDKSWIEPEKMAYLWQNQKFVTSQSKIVPRAGLGPA